MRIAHRGARPIREGRRRTRRDRPEGGDAGLLAAANQQIKRVEAKGDVLSRKKIRPPRARRVCSTSRTNNITLTGNVVVTQGMNVLTGERMVLEPDEPA